ncbi:MAG TPA: HD domain-containing protein [Candidatus Saccharimonadales bacterium]
MSIQDIIRLSELLGEMGHVKRATKLPNHEDESDSHHSFSLALVSYHIATAECPELDANKVMLFALCHDLLEIITGDENTLYYTPEQHAAKHAKEQQALGEFDEVFANYPELKQAMYEYEKLDTPEAAMVFVLDKASTTWTHHPHAAKYARANNIHSKADVEAWADRQRNKIKARLRVMPPATVMDIYERSFAILKELYDD